MKDGRRFKRTPALVATLVVALLLLVGVYTVIAASPAEPDPDLSSVSGSATAWGSPWSSINQGQTLTFNHNLGGDPNTYAVELWFRDTDGDLGINRSYYGGLEAGGNWYGAHWQNLTANTIEVYRQLNDTAADQVRVLVWVPSAPDYDSTWTAINPGQTLIFAHSLGITETDLTVSLWFSGTSRGIHNYGYGGLEAGGNWYGAYWHNLTTNTVQVTRYPNGTDVTQVRVKVVHGAPPDYDSLAALGGWQSIAPGTRFTFTHNLNWNPSMLLVQGECYSSTVGGPGIHQWFAGGNHDWLVGWQGSNVQNLTRNTVELFRQLNDQVCPQARIRIWKRTVQIYLPIVLKDS